VPSATIRLKERVRELEAAEKSIKKLELANWTSQDATAEVIARKGRPIPADVLQRPGTSKSAFDDECSGSFTSQRLAVRTPAHMPTRARSIVSNVHA
jgi:hypothetical protein